MRPDAAHAAGPPAPPAVDVVTVGFHRPDLIVSLVRSIRSGTLQPARIVVVDNESDPAELATVRAADAGITCIANASNRGFAAACNQGAAAGDSPLILFVNPDIVLEPDTLRHAVEAIAADPSIAILTVRLVLPDGSLDHACHRGTPTPAASLAYVLRLRALFPRARWAQAYTMGWADRTVSHEVEACSGAFMLMRRETFNALGGWDERFRFYAEDLDLCLRARAAGGRIWFLADAAAMHLKGATSHLRDRGRLSADQRAVRARVRREIEAAHRAFFEKHFAGSMPAPTRGLMRGYFGVHSLATRVRYRG